MTRKALKLLLWARAAVRCFSRVPPPVNVPSASHEGRHRLGSLHFGDVRFCRGLGEQWGVLEAVHGQEVRRRGCVMLRGGRSLNYLYYPRHVFISHMTRKASKLLIWARAAVLCFSKVVRLQLMYPRPPIRVVTVLGVSIFGMSFLAGGFGSGGTGWRRCMGGWCAEEVT